MAQENELQALLGTKLYDKIFDLIETGDITLPANSSYKTLLDKYIIPVVMYNGYYRLINFATYQFTDKGLQTRKGEFSDASDASIVRMMRNDAKNDAELKDSLLVDYICENGNEYPEYNTTTVGLESKASTFFTGIAFPNEDQYAYKSNKGLDNP